MDAGGEPVAVILAAGAGTRLGELGRRYGKAMLPLLGRPLIRWVGERLASAGCPPRCVVAHPDDHRLRDEVSGWRPPPQLAFQPERHGSADALARAGEVLPPADLILVVACDSVFPVADLRRFLAEGAAHGPGGALGVSAMGRAATAARSAVSLAGALVADIIEKPDPAKAPSGVVGLPLYLLPARALALAATEPLSPRGESELSGVVRRLIAEGVRVCWVECNRFEVTTPGDLLRASLGLLEDLGVDRVPRELRGSRRRYLPPVVVERGARVGASARVGPRVFVGSEARVGAGAVVEDAVLFGSVAIPPGARVRGALHWG